MEYNICKDIFHILADLFYFKNFSRSLKIVCLLISDLKHFFEITK